MSHTPSTPRAITLRTQTLAQAGPRLALAATVAIALLLSAAEVSSAATWRVDTAGRTEAQIRQVWAAHMPRHAGGPYAVAPRTSKTYAPGQAAPGFIADGLRTINFARYLAGLPADVVTTPALNSQAQHGAVLLAASIYSHFPTATRRHASAVLRSGPTLDFVEQHRGEVQHLGRFPEGLPCRRG